MTIKDLKTVYLESQHILLFGKCRVIDQQAVYKSKTRPLRIQVSLGSKIYHMRDRFKRHRTF